MCCLPHVSAGGLISQGLFTSLTLFAASSRVFALQSPFNATFLPTFPFLAHSMTQRALSELKNDAALLKSIWGICVTPELEKSEPAPFPPTPHG